MDGILGIGSRATRRRTARSVRRGGLPMGSRRRTLAVGQAQDQQVGGALDRLVDEGGADVAGLHQDRLELVAGVLGLCLCHVEDALGVLARLRDVGVERLGPVDLDDVDRDDLGVDGLGEVEGEAHDARVG